MAVQNSKKLYSLVSQLIAMIAFTALLVIGLTWWLAGFSLILGTAALAAVATLFGPAVAESGGGILEFLSGLMELIGETLGTALQAISSIFSGFG